MALLSCICVSRPGLQARNLIAFLAQVCLQPCLILCLACLTGCLPSGRADGTVRVDGGVAPDGGADAGVVPNNPDAGRLDTGPSRGPTPPRAGVRFPFPQNRMSANCVYPRDYRNEDVQAAYAQWKAETVTSAGARGHLRVTRPKEPVLDPDTTVSEGIAYGLIIAVYMADQTLFDELWKYEQMYLDDNGLMDWYISADGTKRLGVGGATDADEDMALALLMADKQWGGRGTLDKTYLQNATEQIAKIWNHEIVDGKLVAAGDHFGDAWNNVNISYFAPAYYRLFKSVNVSGADWDAVIKTVYDTIDIALNVANGNQGNGLVPAWCASHDTVCAPNPGEYPTGTANYQYDSCRTPFRIAMDWCWFGEARAKTYLAKTSAFFSAIGAPQIADGYALDGTPQPANAGQGSAAFVGPAGVGAMSSPAYQGFVDQAYAAVATRALLAGGVYYEESWAVMSLLMMTGNFIDFTQLP
jgi:endo-1,4-beta-D-glucanase Y